MRANEEPQIVHEWGRRAVLAGVVGTDGAVRCGNASCNGESVMLEIGEETLEKSASWGAVGTG